MFAARHFRTKLIVAFVIMGIVPVAAFGISAGLSFHWDTILALIEESGGPGVFIEMQTFLAAMSIGLTGIVIAIIVMAGILSGAVTNYFIKPLNRIIEEMKHIAAGDISEKVEPPLLMQHIAQQDELGKLVTVLQEMKGQIRAVLNETASLSQAVRQGNLSTHAQADAFAGGWRKLVQGVNAVIDAFVLPGRMIAQTIDRIAGGDLPEPLGEDFPGAFKPIARNLNLLIEKMQHASQLAEDIDSGTPAVPVGQHPPLCPLVYTLNRLVSQRDALLEEITNIAQAIQTGRSDVRGIPETYEGTWRDLVMAVNTIIDGFVSPMTRAAQTIDRVAKGDLPEPLREDDHGDFNKITHNLNRLIGSMQKMTQSAEAMAGGDFTIDVNERSEHDTLMHALKTMRANVQEIVLHVKTAADQVAADSQELSTSSERMAQGAIEQAASAGKMTISTEQMTASIRQNAEDARQTEEIAQQLVQYAEISHNVVAETSTIMKQIADQISMVEDIADQTRLLSLNATIVAAQAHEHGRAFAVVAEEVRNLADRSRKAAKEINTLVRSSLHVSERAEEMLITLGASIQQTAAFVRKISMASREQQLGAEQINNAIQQLDGVIQHNVSTSEDIAATAEQLAIRSGQLQERIRFFRIDDTLLYPSDEDQRMVRQPAAPYLVTASRKTLTIGITQEFGNLHPIMANMTASQYLIQMYSRALMSITADGKWYPDLLTAIPTLENGLASFYGEKGDKKIQAECELKDNIRWGDGTPVTNEDILFAWQVAMDKHVTVGDQANWAKIERVAIDPRNDRKFTLHFAQADWRFNRLPGYYALPKHLEGPIIEKSGNLPEAYKEHTLYTTEPTLPGLSLGPYRIAGIKAGSYITLVPNEYFYGKTPYFQQIIVKFIPSTKTLEANLLSGAIDMSAASIGLTFSQTVALERRIQEKQLPYVVDSVPGFGYEHIDLQLNNPLLKDIRVRKALVYAINRDAMCHALFGEKQPKAIHNIAPVDPRYTDDPQKVVLYDYAPAKANALLDEAGWRMRDDGYRYKEGQKLTFQLMTTAGDKSRELVEEYLQQEWKNVGIEITIHNEPANTMFDVILRKRQFSAMLMFAWVDEPEMTLSPYLHSRSIACEANGFSGRNYSGWKNKDVDSLLQQIDVTFDHETRKELVAKVLYHYTNEVPVIPLYYLAISSIRPTDLAGYQVSPSEIAETNRIEDWHLRE